MNVASSLVRSISTAIAVATFAGMASSAWASEGVLEINHACALAGCFAGDSPGYPVSIGAPGSYRLTSNLNAPTTSGVVVNSSGVILDLGGFRISGPIVCDGSPIVCTPSTPYGPSGVEVFLNQYEGVIIRNGTVTGFGSGIATGRSNLVENVTAIRNQRNGVVLREGSTAKDVRGIYNGRMGIEVTFGGQIIDSIASYNAQFGMSTGGTPTNGGATIRNSTIQNNDGTGIYDSGRSIIEGCTINGNSGPGIDNANGGSLIVNSVITANGGAGVNLRGDTQWVPGGATTAFSGNSLTSNSNGSAGAQIIGQGAKVFLSPSLCGNVICN
jgi:hypothetical protein